MDSGTEKGSRNSRKTRIRRRRCAHIDVSFPRRRKGSEEAVGSGAKMTQAVAGCSPPEKFRLLAVATGHDDVPMVLDGVVGPPREESRDESPLVAVHALSPHQPHFLLFREGPLVDPRVKLVKPPQSTALTYRI